MWRMTHLSFFCDVTQFRSVGAPSIPLLFSCCRFLLGDHSIDRRAADGGLLRKYRALIVVIVATSAEVTPLTWPSADVFLFSSMSCWVTVVGRRRVCWVFFKWLHFLMPLRLLKFYYAIWMSPGYHLKDYLFPQYSIVIRCGFKYSKVFY